MIRLVLADLSHGHTLAADWLWLIAAVVAVLAALAPSVVLLGKLDAVVRLLAVAVALAALGWLVV
jgi:hypothetical protein